MQFWLPLSLLTKIIILVRHIIPDYRFGIQNTAIQQGITDLMRLEWDNHEWRSTTDAPELGTNPNEQRTNP